MTRRFTSLVLSAAAVAVCAVPAAAQPAAPGPTTQVLVTLTVKPGVDRAELMQTLPQEVRDTVKLYLDGKIQQWFSRSDGSGVVFLVNATSVADATALMDALPLMKGGLATCNYVALGPLRPLGLLIAQPAATSGGGAARK